MKGATALMIAGGLALLGGLAALIFPLPASLAGRWLSRVRYSVMRMACASLGWCVSISLPAV